MSTDGICDQVIPPVGFDTLASAELYDPPSGTWSVTGSLATRSPHSVGALVHRTMNTVGRSDDGFRSFIARNFVRRHYAKDQSSHPQARSNRTMLSFGADAHRDDGKRFVVRADEKLSAFLS